MSKGHSVSDYPHTQQLNDYANLHNQNFHAWWDNLDNHANHCNPKNDEYLNSRDNYDDSD